MSNTKPDAYDRDEVPSPDPLTAVLLALADLAADRALIRALDRRRDPPEPAIAPRRKIKL